MRRSQFSLCFQQPLVHFFYSTALSSPPPAPTRREVSKSSANSEGTVTATAGVADAKGTGGIDKMAALKEIYNKLKAEVLEDHAVEITNESAVQWIDRV